MNYQSSRTCLVLLWSNDNLYSNLDKKLHGVGKKISHERKLFLFNTKRNILIEINKIN